MLYFYLYYSFQVHAFQINTLSGEHGGELVIKVADMESRKNTMVLSMAYGPLFQLPYKIYNNDVLFTPLTFFD